MPNLRRRLLATAVLLAAVVAPAAAQNTVSLEEGAITFDLPEGFTQLTAEQIATKYPAGPSAPRYAFGTVPDIVVSVAVTFSPASVTPEQLPELRDAMAEMMPRLNPTIQVVAKEMVEINGRTWVHLESTSQAIDTQIHNHTFLTSFRGKMLGFNFNSTKEKYYEVREQLLQSSRSIRLTP